MFRHERPQKGRYRQFHQFGVEALGFAGPDVDAEHIVMCAALWQRLGLHGIRLELNNIGSAEERGALPQRPGQAPGEESFIAWTRMRSGA